MIIPSAREDGSMVCEPAAGFAAVLRDATKGVHREAERCGFIADLIRGRTTRHGYAVYLRNLEPAYAALEQGLDSHPRSGQQVVTAFADSRLRRLPALRRDLAAIAGDDWMAAVPALPEAAAYAAAITDAGRGDGIGLAAHAYARYLGDLSGGQILRPLLARNLGLGPVALGLYEFTGFPDLDVPKRMLREALDRMPPTGAEAEAFIEEAVVAFRHNMAVSLAVGAAVSAAPA